MTATPMDVVAANDVAPPSSWYKKTAGAAEHTAEKLRQLRIQRAMGMGTRAIVSHDFTNGLYRVLCSQALKRGEEPTPQNTYTVRLSAADETTADASCTCPDYRKWDTFCKHMILVAVAKGVPLPPTVPRDDVDAVIASMERMALT